MTVDDDQERWHVEIPGQPEPTQIVKAVLTPV
jgi:hypothetical protein